MTTPGCTLRILSAVTICLALWSCRPGAVQPTEEWCGTRDNVEKATLVPFGESLPDIGGFNEMFISGDTLIINYISSQDKLFFAYDLNKDKYIGSFGRYGDGPGEMANIGGIFIDDKGRLFASNANHMNIQYVDIDKALHDDDYKANVQVKHDISNGFMPIACCKYMNDTTVLCSIFTPGRWSYNTHVGRFNPQTGVGVVIDSITTGKDTDRSAIAVSPGKNLIASVGMSHDRIRLFDLDGNLKKTIYGPEYEEKRDNKYRYFANAVIGDDKIYALFRGKEKDLEKSSYSSEKMIVMDLDGRYIKTLDFGYPLVDMVYHNKTNRLYISTDGEPQFGYLQLD